MPVKQMVRRNGRIQLKWRNIERIALQEAQFEQFLDQIQVRKVYESKQIIA